MNMNKYRLYIVRLVAAALLASIMAMAAFVQPALAASIAIIPGLFNTGVDNNGDPIAAFSAGGDTHYTLEGPNITLGAASVINNHPAWLPAPIGSSQWIGAVDFGGRISPGTYKFTTTFDLTGLDPASAIIGGRVAADNVFTVSLNGIGADVSAGGPVGGFTSLTPFLFDSTGGSAFINGINTLEFAVLNGGIGFNPMGLLVTDLTGSAKISAIPLPPSAILFATGLLGLGAAGRRRRKKKAAAR